MDYIPFERPLAELDMRIDELRRMAATQAISLDEEIAEVEEQARQLRERMFANLSPYETVQLSRHPKRPNTKEIIQTLSSSFVELHGDRNFYDDPSIVGGLARTDGHALVVIGHQKGRGTKENIARNFGMPKPEGYRKALRLMSLAERFELPVVTFIDTPGAYPGIGAEERGQSEAIGKNILVMSRLQVPVICFVIGEGGSGGALALGVANRIHMLQYAVYSVISPEGGASILMKDASKANDMANALQLTATSALKFKVIDSVIEEPKGGAHQSLEDTAQRIAKVLRKDLSALRALGKDELVQQRMNKFMKLGMFESVKGST